ncbi:S8 family serine peptidase [Zhihengliuella halotolerans]|uniref:Subtilase family protein n=1 Tax=Zhihengliuella halotolerans TaxID=370736 RepID=A0A4Q8AD56_9MICC|nr:S8 family serine peptidase [Zhihengliuella halotolerans]RZU62118.1 subtilase family protein [Zhihengliuella halotolerans]
MAQHAARSSRGMRRPLGALAVLAVAAGTVLIGPPANAAHPRDSQYWLEDYGIEEAWKTSRGEGVKVAVIDTGVDDSHPDLRGAVVGGTDSSGAGSSDGTEAIGPLPEHGTLVATMLAGRGNNETEIKRAEADAERQDIAYKRAKKKAEEEDEDPPEKPEPIEIPEPGPGDDGIIGVAPKAELLTASVWLGAENPAGVGIEEQIPNAVRWAVDQGADVINLSMGSTSTSWPQSWDEAFLYAEEHDVVVVAAAGNRAGGMTQVGAPATIPGVLTVAGVDREREASWDASTQGITIGVSAPADPLVGGLPGGGYAGWSGSSGAAPLVAGVAALIRSAEPDLPAADVINRILATADDAGDPGFDNIYGYGILDAEAALTTDVPPVESNPLGTIAEWIRVHRRADTDPSTEPAAPDQEATSSIDPVDAPRAAAPPERGEVLAPALLFGFGALALFVVAFGGARMARTRRLLQAQRVSEGTIADAEWKVGRGHDPFDDLPEKIK